MEQLPFFTLVPGDVAQYDLIRRYEALLSLYYRSFEIHPYFRT